MPSKLTIYLEENGMPGSTDFCFFSALKYVTDFYFSAILETPSNAHYNLIMNNIYNFLKNGSRAS